MAQYQDGDSRQINGVTYVRTDGSWVPHVQSQFGAPTLPYAAPQAQADLTGKTIDNTKSGSTLPYDIETAKNNAIKSGIDVRTAQVDLNTKTGTPPGDLGKTGPAYLATLPPGVGDLTREMLAGKYKGSITTSRNPVVMQAALAAAHATSGNFDAGKYDERLAFIKSITDPNSQLGALNTALAHAKLGYDQAAGVAGTAALGHGPLSMGLNAVDNWWNKGAPGVTTYNSTLQKYVPEAAKAYSIGTGGERTDMQGPYNPNLPLDSKRADFANDVALFSGKINSMAHQFDMLGANSPMNYFSPDALAAIKEINPKEYERLMAMGVAGAAHGNNQLPPPGPGFTPPPTGPAGGITPSTNGYNDTPDPQSAQFWANAARQQVPYRDALSQWQQDVSARGLVGQTPPPPDAYQKAASYIHDNPNVPYQPFSSVTRKPVSPFQQAATDAAFSGPGVAVGHTINAAAATLPTLMAGDQGARYNAVSNATHPNWATAGDIAGTVAGAYGAGKLAEGAAPSLGKFGNLIAGNPSRAALAGDSLFMGGSGAAQNPDNPVLGGMGGALAGLTGNLAGRYMVGPGIRALMDTSLVQGAINGVGGMFGRSFSPPAALDAGQNMLFKRANGDALGGIQTNLQDAANANLPYMLADSNPQLRALAGSAARKSPDVQQTAESLLGPRQQGQAERAIGQINRNLAAVGDVPTMQAATLKQAQAQSGPLYDAAKAQPAPDLAHNPQLAEVLDRPAAQAAIRKGYETALNNGEDVGTLTYATDPNGSQVQYGNPSWSVIHYARQALDSNGETAVRRALDKQIAGINPAFKAADANYSGIMKGSDALQAGANATGIGVTPEATQNALKGFPNHAPQFQQGYASNMADAIERQRLSGNPYNLVNGSLGQQAKLNMIFPGGAPDFARAQALEGDMGKTYQGVLGNSATAGRTEADKQFDALEMGGDVAKGIMTGGTSVPFDVGMTLARKAANAGANNLQVRMSMAKANALAPYLFNPDPNANLLMLNDMMSQQAARKAYLQNFGAATGNLGAGMFGAPILYGASGQ